MKDHRDLAAQLRAEEPVMDDLARARVERELVRRTPGEAPREEKRRGFAAGVAVGLAAAAAVLLIYTFSGDEHDAPSIATRPVEEPAAERLSDGAEIATTHDEERVARFGQGSTPSTTVTVLPGSQVRFAAVSARDHHLVLSEGSVRVEFHPEHRGFEHVLVETSDVRVHVVGTVFQVSVSERGTEVVVDEGRVRVEGRRTDFVAAGERLFVERQRAGLIEPDIDSETLVAETLGAETLGAEAGHAEVREAAPEAREVVAMNRRENASSRSPSPVAEELLEEDENVPSDEEVTPEPASPAEVELGFERALEAFDRGDLAGARHELYALVRAARSGRTRAKAWTLVAETFEREDDTRRAIEAYRRASRGDSVEASDARFALARLRVSAGDRAGGIAAYNEYLQVSPEGALAGTVHRALCRLGERRHCFED